MLLSAEIKRFGERSVTKGLRKNEGEREREKVVRAAFGNTLRIG